MALGIPATILNGWLDGSFGTVYVKLHTGDPGASGASNAAAGDTTRKQATMGTATGASKAMTVDAGPWTNGGTSETLTHVSLWSASTSGTFLGSAALSASQAWVNTNTFTLTGLTLSVTPVAA